MSIKDNLDSIRPILSGQTIIAAAKYVGEEKIRELYRNGIVNIGENRVDALLEMKQRLKDLPITWHFIGQLQTNKVKKVINEIDYLHSLDRMSLAEAIQKYRQEPLRCFLEIHISDEVSKAGIEPQQALEFCRDISGFDKIEVVGLMGMAPLTGDKDKIRNSFMLLKQLQEKIRSLNLDHCPAGFLSMGMSGDYEIAIECGATHLRLGSILFRNEE